MQEFLLDVTPEKKKILIDCWPRDNRFWSSMQR